MLLFLFSCSLSAPEKEAKSTVEEDPVLTPSSGRMWRLTEQQYRNKVLALTAIQFEGELPVDYDLHGYISVGSGESAIAPYDLELYETAAWEIAQSKIVDRVSFEEFVDCSLFAQPSSMIAEEAIYDINCVEQFVTNLAEHLWYRTLLLEERQEITNLFEEIANQTNVTLAGQAVYASMLLSPSFLLRTEGGEIDGEGKLRLTAFELAERLSYFLTDGPPDEQLLVTVQDGSLHQDDVLEFQARRLLQSPKSKDALINFFRQTIDIERILSMDKNAELFPYDSEELRQGMIAELDYLFWMAVESGDFREILTSSYAYVNPSLASFYGLSVNEPSLQMLPSNQQRGGLLGRAGFLALNSTAVRSSPTHRGKFIRTRLLCHDVPPPPEGVVASLDEIDDSLPLRQQLEQHMADPACVGCHQLTDPLGFPLEHYDAMGQWRELDNGHPVDASGSVDGVDVDGAASLGMALAAHHRFSYCVTAQLMRHATGSLEGTSQYQYVTDLTNGFEQSDYDFRQLVVSLVLSEAFRFISGSLNGNVCTDSGAQRQCESVCGEGIELCIDGQWQGCNAPPPQVEVCDGIDQDCDGVVDNLVQTCEFDGVLGVQECLSGAWDECSYVSSPEVCDGADNDWNGLIDDNLQTELVHTTFSELKQFHPACDPLEAPVSGPCNAAANRLCEDRGCDMRTGFGLLHVDPLEELAIVSCLHSDLVDVISTTFETLAESFAYCFETDPVSANCNAAINRHCASIGLSTGFGPLEHSSGTAVIACTPTADVHQVPYDDLTALQQLCHWPEQRYSEACNTAMHQWCSAQGYQTGYGPLENYQNDAWVACIPFMEEGR